jgi:hypothetical protein
MVLIYFECTHYKIKLDNTQTLKIPANIAIILLQCESIFEAILCAVMGGTIGLLGPKEVGVVGGEIEELLEDLKTGTPTMIEGLEVEDETVPLEGGEARMLVELS